MSHLALQRLVTMLLNDLPEKRDCLDPQLEAQLRSAVSNGPILYGRLRLDGYWEIASLKVDQRDLLDQHDERNQDLYRLKTALIAAAFLSLGLLLYTWSQLP